MIKYYEGTVFNTGAKAIVNTINCEGAMGAGLALEFMLRYPEMYEDYKVKCDKKLLKPGIVDYYVEDDGCTIINVPTKWLFKYPSRIEWIEQGLQYFVSTYKEHNIKAVAFPKLGASNGGLDWDEVRSVMEKYLSNVDADVYICTDTLRQAEGIEKQMLDIFNSMTLDQIGEIVRLTSKQRDNLEIRRPYSRFWLINKTPSIGAKTYASVFRHCYSKALNNESMPEQMTLF